MIRFSQSELEELERALKAGEDVEAPEPERPHLTRLHRALNDGDLARAKLLLHFGANADVRDAYDQRPVRRVIAGTIVDEETRADMIRLLCAAGADMDAKDTYGDSPLTLAYRKEHFYCVRALVDAGADPSISGECGALIPTFIVDLIRNPDGAEAVANILATGVNLNAEDNSGHTLLDRAAFCGSPSAVRALLDAGADPNAETSLPPLCSAAALMKSDGGEETVVALIRAGADVDKYSLFFDEMTPLHYAVQYRSLAAVRLLLDSGANSDLPSGGGQTPLCDAVEYARDDNDHAIIKALLQGGADVNRCDGDFIDRPLHVASGRGHTSTVRLLLESGADLRLRNRVGETALHAAAQGRDCAATVSALLEAGADPNAGNKGGNTPLHDALQRHRSPAVIQLLLDGGADARIRGWQGRTALHCALENRDCTATVLSALLDAGADPNARDDHGLMSLHFAARWCSPAVTQLLLKAGADPRSHDNNGCTPLLYATLAAERNTRWLEHAAALCDAGANVNCTDAKGITPLYHALRCARREIILSLLQLGADPFVGRKGILVSPRAIVGLIGKINMETILAFVTRVRFQLEDTSFAQDQCISCRDLSQSEKEGCKVLARTLREQMLEQPTSERKGFIALLSTLYTTLDYYPPHPALHECEVTLPRGRASYFGGFADCWKGLFLGRHAVAMKTFRGSLAEEVGTRRLAREAKVWNQLSHPSVLPFLGLCILDSVPYLVSPWMENGHVLDFVQKNPNVDRLRLLAQVADGLRYLHSFQPRPVIHGDLRGPNILISSSGNACITDFGLSELKTDTYETNYSTPFITAGHPRWQAPEIVRAENKEEARRNTTTDVFAFGRVSLEMFTGRVPFFDLAYDAAVITKVQSSDPFPRRPGDEASGLDDTIWQLMMDCWHATPTERPTATDLVARLTTALESRSASESSSSNNESSVGSSKSSMTLDAMADTDTEGLAARRLGCPGQTKSPPSERESSASKERSLIPDEEDPAASEEIIPETQETS